VAFWLFYQFGDTGPPELFVVETTLGERLSGAIRILGAHTWLVFKPHPLNFGYPFEIPFSVDSNFLLGLGVLLAWVVSAIRSRTSITTVAISFYLVFLAPALQLFGDIRNAIVFDRYLFMPMFGIALLFGFACYRLAARGRRTGTIVSVIALSLVLLLSTLSHLYAFKFKSNVASLQHTYRTFPDWGRGSFNYAYALIEAKEFERAERLIRTEKSFSSPEWVRGYLFGWLLLETGQLDQAIAQLTRSSLLAGQGGYYPFPDLHLARAYALKGESELSRRHLLKILGLGSSHPLQYYRALTLYRQWFGEYAPEKLP
jgi:tetratricopeptide (TPR) repeat protein